MSVAMLAFVGAAVVGATTAYFSDTETSTGNTITAGSLDLKLNGYNGEPVSAVVVIEDMKPSQTWYSGPITLEVFDNPGRLYKHIVRDGCGGMTCSSGDITEPECVAEGGTWMVDPVEYCHGAVGIDYLPEVTWFDLEVWVGNPDNAVSGQDAPMCEADDLTEDCWDVLIEDGDALIDDTGIFGSPVDYVLSKWIYLGTYGYPQMTNKIVIRQSFHMDGPLAGNEYQGDTCTFNEEFMVLQTNAPHPDPLYVPLQNVTLDSINVGDSDSVSMEAHDAQGWLDYVQGDYGGQDGGESIAMVWGDGGVCDVNNDDATFELDAGTETATTLTLRHYDGVSDDSFDVYVNGTLVGSYANQNSTESPSHWYTTDFSVNYTGNATIEIVATGPAGGYCAYHQDPDYYGQVALNWAKITN